MLEIGNLRCSFGPVVAVENLDLIVERRSIVGLVGRNGAGKTTTMRAIMGIVHPERGQISWDGHPVVADDRMAFGYMPEERGLYPQMRLVDQVAYFARLHGLEAEAASDAARRWLDRLELAEHGSDKLVALSHGNQQRVQLAVALVHGPGLLVLDEPFAGLDPTAVDTLSGILRSQAGEGTAVLFSSHQLELVEMLCDRIVILETGRVVASGTLEDLQAQLPRRLRVLVDAPPGWAVELSALTGTEVVEDGPHGVVIALEEGSDPQAVLKVAEAAGPVQHFGFEAAGLAEVYRRAVSR